MSDGGRPASSMARVIAQLRTNDPSVSNLAICQSVPDPIRVEIAEALTQNTVVRRIMLQPHDYSHLSTDSMAKYLVQSKRLLLVELMGEPLRLFGFLLGIILDLQEHVLCTFLEAIGQRNSVKEPSLMNLGLGPASESFENLLTRTKTLRHLQVDLERQGPLEEAATAAIASGFSINAERGFRGNNLGTVPKHLHSGLICFDQWFG
jgi:hypothetical protein